jgi:hypothetical protein
MKLFKIIITPIDVVPPDPDFIMESEDIEELRRRAESIAKEQYHLSDLVWVFGEKEQNYMELTVEDECRLVIRN